MSLKSLKKISLLALIILSLGAVFLLTSIFNLSAKAGGGENMLEQGSQESGSWVDNVLNAADISEEMHYGVNCMVIDSADDLARVAYELGRQNPDSDYVNGNFYLAADIDLAGKTWTPIGTTTTPFNGVFFGNGFTISNITIAQASQYTSSDVGLFGAVTGSIVDLNVAGDFSVSAAIDSAYDIGVIVGDLQGNGQVVNCIDQTQTQGAAEQYLSIAATASTSKVIYPSSLDGVTPLFEETTIENMQSALSFAGDAQTGYSTYFNTGVVLGSSEVEGVGAGFYSNGSYTLGNAAESQQIRVAFSQVSEAGYSNALALNIPLYTDAAPVLRVNAQGAQVYALRSGFEASIGSPSLSSAGIVTLSWQERAVTIAYDYGYGNRTLSFSVGYDTPWNSVIASRPIQRLGYTNQASVEAYDLYSNEEKNQPLNTTTPETYSTYYAADGDTVYMSWKNARSNLTGLLYFGADQNEGGIFANSNASNAVSGLSVSGADIDASQSNSSNLTNISADRDVVITFNLNAGYIFQAAGVGSNLTSRTGWDQASSVTSSNSGAYTYYPNETGMDSEEGGSYVIATGGYFDSYTPISITVANQGNSYTITISNIVDLGGEIVLLFGREELDISIEGTGLDHISDAELNLTGASSQTSLDWSGKTITTKIGESFNFVLSSSGQYYILSRSVEGFESVISDSSATNVGGTDFYQQTTFEISSFTPDVDRQDFTINVDVSMLLTYITVQIGDNGTFYQDNSVPQNKQVALSITSGQGVNESILSKGTFQVSMTSETVISFAQNGFFTIASVSGADAELLNGSITQIFSTFSGDPNVPAYTITFYPTQTYYGVTINYTIDGQPVSQEIAQKFVSFAGKTQDLDYNKPESYILTLADGAATWLGFNINIVGSNLGSNTSGYQASVVGGSSTGVVNGTFSDGSYQFSYAPGTYNSTLTINLTRKEIQTNFTGLVLNSDKSTIPNTSTIYGSFTLKYDANGTGTLQIVNGGFSSIQIENGYYLLGWYLSNGSTINAFSNTDLIEDDDFLAFVGAAADDANGAASLTVTVNPLVEKRTVNLSYAHGLTSTEGLTDATEISAPTYAYGDSPVSLSTEKYKLIGYSFAQWSAENGTINNNTFSLTGNAWNLFWENDASSAVHSWRAFATTAEMSKEIVLTAQFSALQYTVSIDGGATLTISIGQTISFEASSDGSYAVYTNTTTNQHVNGSTLAGHSAVSFEISGNLESASSQEGLTTFTLTLDNIQALISTDNYYQTAQQNELTILTERTANVYKLYIQANQYYTISLKEGTTAEQGGTDSTGTYVNVTYGQIPTNLSQVVVTRDGYDPTGFTLAGEPFETDRPYALTQNSTLTPVFERDVDSNFVKNQIVLTETDEFTTENAVTHQQYQFHIDPSYFQVVEELDLITTNYARRTFSNGDREIAAAFYQTDSVPSGSVVGNQSALSYQDLLSFLQTARYATTLELSYVVQIEDSLTGDTYLLVFAVEEITFIKNELKISDTALKSYYTGTADYVEVPSSTLGTIIGSRYDINGNEKNEQDAVGQIIDQVVQEEDYSISLIDPENNFTVKAGYGFNFTFGIYGDFEEWYANVAASGPDQTATFSSGAEIVKSIATITFDSSMGIYVADQVQTIAQNVSNATFNVAGNPSYQFTYSFDRLSLVKNGVGSYTGTGNPEQDHLVFSISGFAVYNGLEEVTDNFDWAISTTSTYQVVGGEDFNGAEYRFESRYLTSSNGSLTGLSEGWGQEGLENTFTISNVIFNGEIVSPNNGANFASQYNHIVDGQVVFSIIGNGSYTLVVVVNEDLIGQNPLTFNVTVSSPLTEKLVLFSWQNTETVDESLFGQTLPNPMTSFEYNSSAPTSTYAVFTDVTKVDVDYNLKELSSETIYVSSSDPYQLEDPSDSSGELAFGGYQISGSGIATSDGDGIYTVSLDRAGEAAALKAMWNLTDNVDISIIEGKETITISPLGAGDSFTVTGIFEEKLVHASHSGNSSYGEGFEVYKVEDDGDVQLEKESFPATNALYPYLNDAGFITFENAGRYKIVVTYQYNDTIQGLQTKTKELYFNISVVKDVFEINNMATDNPSLTFANRALDQEVSFSFTNIWYDDWEGLHEDEGSSTISQIAQLEQYLSVATVYYNADPSQQLTWENVAAGSGAAIPFYIKITTPYPEDSNGNAFFNAGEYSVQFVLWNIFTEYVTLQAAESASLTQTIEIDQYTIKLASYNDQIDPGKLVGTDDPDPITDTITIAENQNDSVTLSFDRVTGDTAGLYPLSNPQIVDAMDKNNYFLNDEGFDADFAIAENANGRLVITLPNGLHFTYDGKAVDGFDLVYSEGKFLLQALRSMAVVASTEVQVSISVVDEGSSWREYEIAEEARDDIANTISVAFASGTSATDYATDYLAEGYALSVTLTNDDFQSVGFSESSDGSFYIDQRPLTLETVSKEFDATADFTNDTTIQFTGNVEGHSLTISGSFASAHAGEQSLSGLSISGDHRGNYYIENADSFKGSITPKAATNVSIEIANASNLVYGQIAQNTNLQQYLAVLGQITITVDGLEFVLTDGTNEFISISSITPSGTGIYSTGLKLKAGGQTLVFMLSSSDFTSLNDTDESGRDLAVTIKTKQLDLSDTVISKVYDGTTDLPAGIAWQGFDIEIGDLVSVDLDGEKSFFASNFGNDLVVTVAFTGADSSNYAPSSEQILGDITQASIILQVDVTENLPNDADGQPGFVDGEQEITNATIQISVSYPFAKEANLDDIINGWAKPERVGYTVTGYSYKTAEGNFVTLTADNLKDFLDAIIAQDQEAKIYPNWQRRSFNVTITAGNIASISEPSDSLTGADGDIADGQVVYTILYYEDFNLTFNADAGYKITEFVVSSNYVSKTEGEKGSNTCTLNITSVTGNLSINVITQSIVINFVIDKAIPSVDGVDISETSSAWERNSVNYAEIGDQLLTDFLPEIILTDGTFLLTGFDNDEHDITLETEERNLKQYIDSIYQALDGDKTINLTAQWQGESYTIHFNGGQGGQISDNFDATAVFGGDITLPEGRSTFPVATRAGMVYTYYDAAEGGKPYSEESIFTTIDPDNEVTFYAIWSEGVYDIKFEIDSHLTVRHNGNILQNTTLSINHSESWNFEIIADAGYHFNIDITNFHGQYSDLSTSPFTISGVFADSTLKFEAVANDNDLILSYEEDHIQDVSIQVDSELYEESDLVFKTGTTVTITLTAAAGYEFNELSAILSGSGRISTELSAQNTVLTITWSGFTDDASISVTAQPKTITISWDDLSDYVSDLSINSQSVLESGSFQTQVGQTLSVVLTLRYGYQNAKLSSEGATIAMTSEGFNSSRVWVYHATITDFAKDFTLSLDVENRTYTVAVSTEDYGEENRGSATVSPEGENNLVFGSSVTLTASPSSNEYRFIGWYLGQDLVSEDSTYVVYANEENRQLLESGNLNYQARFDYNSKEFTFSSGSHGQLEVEIYANGNQEPSEIFVVGAGASQNRTLFVGTKVVLLFHPDTGYEIDNFMADEDDLTSEISEDRYEFTVNPNAQGEFVITYKASQVRVDIKVAVQINFINYQGLTDGGMLYLVNEAGDKLEEGYLQPSEGELIEGINYQVLSYTDQVFYLMAEANPGYSFSLSVLSGRASIDQLVVNGKTIYRVSQAQDLSSLQGIFRAEEQRVEVMFVTDEQNTTAALAGRIRLTDNSVPASPSGNNSERISIVTITGAELQLSLSTNFNYSLLSNEAGNVSVVITGGENGTVITPGLVAEYSQEQTLQTGFTYNSTLTISGINSDLTIKILVEPTAYNLQFYIDAEDDTLNGDHPVTIHNVVYGESLDLSSLTQEEVGRLTKTRAGFTLAGYFTKQLSQGTQYLDSELIALQSWLERPYRYDGSQYVVADNYDPETKTFTLYAAWIADQAMITIDFIPPALKDVRTGLSIIDIIDNIDQTVVWINPDNVWVGQFSAAEPLNLELSALTFDGYKFSHWSVTDANGTTEYSSMQLRLSSLAKGDYLIEAVYQPYFTMEIESNNSEDPSLVGQSYLMQNGQRVTGDTFDSTTNVVLVAQANLGYSFLYWRDQDGQIYQGNLTSGRYELDLGIVDHPLYLTACFQGENVGMRIDLSQFSHGQVSRVLVNDEEIVNFEEEFTVRIGDKVEMAISTDNGYGIEFEGATFALDATKNFYKYIVSAQHLENGSVVHEGIIVVRPISSQKQIAFNFDFLVDGAPMIADTSMNGSVRFTYTLNSAILVNTLVDESSVIEGLLFGGTITLNIVPSTNYKVQDVIVSLGGMSENVTELLSNGMVYISSDVLARIFQDNQPYLITINYTRMVWSDDDSRSQELQGSGTEEDPYIISSEEDMGFVAWAVNSGFMNQNDQPYANCHYRLTTNLDFQGKYWEPIGTNENPFNGVMDLGDYSVENITFYQDYINPTPSYDGLFWILGDDAVVIQTNNALVIALSIAGGVLLLALIIILAFVIAKKQRKKKFDELANG